jgi:predicted acylesterase/phospholipase RssA
MKISRKMSGLLLITGLFLMTSSVEIKENMEQQPHPRSGTAIIMTGAAARLPQEAALLEALYNRGLLKNVVFISGVSSGALNAVMLNGILSGKISWSEYKEIIFKIKNSDIFIQEGKKLPVNTDPERKFITNVVEGKLHYKKMGDLPFLTAISFTNIKKIDLKKTVYRMCSRKINSETDTTLSIVDVLMASTSFPIAFPPVRIKNVKTIPDEEYIDGGVGEDHVPFHALFDFERHRGYEVEKIYIISRKSDSIPKVSEELKILGLNDRGMFDRMGISIDNMLKRGIINRLKEFSVEAPDLVPRTFIWIPDFEEEFLMFNFEKLREQYEVTSKWAKTHDPLPLAEFLLPYLIKEKRRTR